VKEEIVGHLIKVYETFVREQLRFIRASVSLFAVPEASRLLGLFVSANIDQLDKAEFFDILLILARECADLRTIVESKLVFLLPDATAQQRIAFLEDLGRRTDISRAIWSAFCNPESRQFNQTLYRDHFPQILKSLVNAIPGVAADEEEFLALLAFFQKARAPARTIFGAQNSQIWFVFDLLPELVPFTRHHRPEIREKIRAVFESCHITLSEMLEL
jgi:hypothetical protein